MKSEKPTIVDWLTLAVAVVALIGGYVKFRLIDRSVAEVQNNLAKVETALSSDEFDYRQQEVLAVSAITSRSWQGHWSDELITIRLLIQNARRVPIRLEQIDVKIQRSPLPEELMLRYPPNTVERTFVSEHEDGRTEPMTRIINHSTLVLIDSSSRADAVNFHWENDEGVAFSHVPSNGVILGGQGREQRVDLLVLDPVSPEVLKVNVTVKRDEGETVTWTDWIAIGGFPTRAPVSNTDSSLPNPEQAPPHSLPPAEPGGV